MIYFLGLILALLPAYLVRFNIGGIPTTGLEILLLVFLFFALLRVKVKDFKNWAGLGKINYAIGLFVFAGIISTLVSPEKARALGQLKSFVVEPILLFYGAILTIKSKEDLRIVLKFLLFGVKRSCWTMT